MPRTPLSPTDALALLDAVLEANAGTRNPRLKRVMAALIRHLHAFTSKSTDARRVAGRLEFLVAIGQATGQKKNEGSCWPTSSGSRRWCSCASAHQALAAESPAGAARPVLARQSAAAAPANTHRARSTPGVPLDVAARCATRGPPDRRRQRRDLAGLARGPVREPGPRAGRHEPARPLRDRCRRPLLVPHGAPGRLPGADRRALRRAAARAAAATHPAGAPALHGGKPGHKVLARSSSTTTTRMPSTTSVFGAVG